MISFGDHIKTESLRTPCAMLHRALYHQIGPGSTYGRTLSSCQKSTQHFMQCNPSGCRPYMLLLIWASVVHVSDVLSSTTSQDPEHTRRIQGPPTFHSIWKVGPWPPISKQCLSRWLLETIQYPYSSQGLPVPQGIKVQLTQKQAASIAELAGATPSTMCDVAPWAFACTF